MIYVCESSAKARSHVANVPDLLSAEVQRTNPPQRCVIASRVCTGALLSFSCQLVIVGGRERTSWNYPPPIQNDYCQENKIKTVLGQASRFWRDFLEVWGVLK